MTFWSGCGTEDQILEKCLKENLHEADVELHKELRKLRNAKGYSMPGSKGTYSLPWACRAVRVLFDVTTPVQKDSARYVNGMSKKNKAALENLSCRSLTDVQRVLPDEIIAIGGDRAVADYWESHATPEDFEVVCVKVIAPISVMP